MPVEIVSGDLLDQDTETIVNAWNRNIVPWWLLLPQGVSGAIKRRAGLEPFRELGRMGPIALGDAVHTGAGRLPYRHLLHVAGINLAWRASPFSIQASTRNAVALAERLGIGSLAMPIIGAGSGGYSVEAAETLMLEALADLPAAMTVRLVRFAPGP